MPARRARSATRTAPSSRPRSRNCAPKGIDARGPLPADTMFHAAARRTYDAALAMYHDQALIPIKTLAFDHAVNVTLGLPFVRTSPDHGTAFDIAGTGRASPASLVAALSLAARLVRADAAGAGQMRPSTTCRRCAKSSGATGSPPASRSARTSCSIST